MFLPIIFNSMGTVLNETQVNEILQTNEEAKKYGLILTVQDAKEIVEVRNRVLQSYGRIELDIGVTRKFIQSFCTSTFINPEEYVSTLNDLHELFYYLKNETEDEIGDDELIDIIKDFFDNSCRGSMELLKSMIETLAENSRRKNQITDYLLEGDIE